MHASPAYTETHREALAGGQPAAFEQFYRDHHARIYNLAARIVGDPDDAADITQEVFLRAYTHPLEARDDLRPEPWLYRIAVNASYDHLRRRAARPSTSLDTVAEIPDTSDGFVDGEIAHCVETCLAGLTPRYRTALVLKDLHGLSHAEIAEVMDIHQGAARVLLHRARAAFRRAFRSTAPTGAGGITTLGLAAFLPDLPVPASLQAPPLLNLVPPATVPAASPPPDLVGPATGGGHTALSGAAPTAAVPVAAAPLAPAGLLAGLGGAVAAKVAVAVIATVVVAGGGVAVGHYSETPASLDAAANATSAGAATSSLAAPTAAPWTRRQMIRERLQSAGLVPQAAGELDGAGAAARGAPGSGGNGPGGGDAGASSPSVGGTTRSGYGTGSNGTSTTGQGGTGSAGTGSNTDSGGVGGTAAGDATGPGTGGTGGTDTGDGAGTGPGTGSGDPSTGDTGGGTGAGGG